MLPKGELPQLRKAHGSATSLASSSSNNYVNASSNNRPRGPPPPTPMNGPERGGAILSVPGGHQLNNVLVANRNGRSTESLSSVPSDGELNDKPLPVRGKI